MGVKDFIFGDILILFIIEVHLSCVITHISPNKMNDFDLFKFLFSKILFLKCLRAQSGCFLLCLFCFLSNLI